MENLAKRLKIERKNSGLSLVQAAKYAGVSDKTWAKWEDAESSPDIESLEKFCEKTGFNLLYLLRGNDASLEGSDERMLPIVARIPAGPLTQGFGEEGAIGYEPSTIKDPIAFWLMVTGTSMLPEIVENDLVLCSPKASFVNGKIYATVVGEGEQSLKRVRYNAKAKAFALIPSNKEFETMHVAEQQIIKLVRVVEVRRDLQ